MNPTNWTADQVQAGVAVLTLVGAAIGFFIAVNRYVDAQKWKRHEFVASQIKEFNADPLVRNAMLIIDWGSRSIELHPARPKYEDRYVSITRDALRQALVTHDKIGRRYTDDEAAIRDCFDAFFGGLDRFQQFVEAGLVEIDDFRPYLQYWADSLGKEIRADARDVIAEYLHYYRFTGAQKLLKIYGADLNPAKPVVSDPEAKQAAVKVQEIPLAAGPRATGESANRPSA